MDQMAEFHGEELRFIAIESSIVKCNWKVTAEAFLEVYHFRHIHGNNGEAVLDNRGASMGLLPHGCSRMITPFSGSACKARRHDATGRTGSTSRCPGFADVDSVSDMVRSTSSAWSFFPNLITPVASYGFPFLLFWPIDKGTTRLDWVHYGPKDWEGDDLPDRWQSRLKVFDQIMYEDVWNMEPMQRSLESPAMSGVPINYQERRIWWFNEEVDRVIGPDRIPEQLRRAAAAVRASSKRVDGLARRRWTRRHAAEHGAQRLRRAHEAGALVGHDDLGVVAVGELGQRVELQDGHQRRVRVGRRDGAVDGGDGLRAALGLEDGGLAVALGPEDGGLALALGGRGSPPGRRPRRR